MKSIKNMVQKDIIINKSKFYNFLYPVSSVDECNELLAQLRETYPDANHHCFAYIIGEHQEVQKFSDDGEPSKTAGLPMLEVLKKNDLTNVLIVSVRYFGGIKLGAGGLVRAYTKGCAECVKDSDEALLKEYTTMTISISFDLIGVVEKYIRDHYNLIDTQYDQFVHYTIEIESSVIKNIENDMTERTNGQAQFKIISSVRRYV